MAAEKFITIKGSGSLTARPFYIGIVQHDRTMTKKETYAFLAGVLGYTEANIKGVFMGLKEWARESGPGSGTPRQAWLNYHDERNMNHKQTEM